MGAISDRHGGAGAHAFAMPSIPDEVRTRSAVAKALSRSTGPVAAVRAPGGYGKTTQIASWCRADPRPVAWIDLLPLDNDPGVLLPLLIDALWSVTDLSPRDSPGTAGPPDHRPTIVDPAFGRALRRTTVPFILVLDDVQVIEEGPSAELIGSLLRNVPLSATVVLIGRGELNVPLARLRSSGALIEVRTSDLALDASDATRVLHALGVAVDKATTARIVAETEGWPVGVRLAGLAIREDGSGLTRLLSQGLGREQSVADYVREEWLRGVSGTDLEFLRSVSGLTRLDGPACDAILGRTDSAAHLSRLAGHRLAVMPLERRGDIYRMHDLLRDVLDAELQSSDRPAHRELHLRSSQHFEHIGLITEAIHHAFRAGDVALAERIVCEHAPAYQTRGRYITVHRWLESFTSVDMLSSGALCLIAAMSSLGMGDGRASAAWAKFGVEALRSIGSTDTETALELAAWNAAISTGPISAAMADAAQAVAELRPGYWHALAGTALGASAFAVGDDDLAREALTESMLEARVVGATSVEANSQAHLALVDLEAGDLAGARERGRAARMLIREQHLEEMPTLVLVSAVSALVAALDGHLDEAERDGHLARHHLARLKGVASWANVQSRLALARSAVLCGDRPAARLLIDEAEVFLRNQPDACRPRRQIAALGLRMGEVGPEALTAAELRVLQHLPTNLTIAEIAERLYVSRNTAKSHSAAVYRKLGVTSRSEAVEAARACGLLAPEGGIIAVS
jgi:LuxR family maltose regulon positive regulatory protein